MTEPKPLTRKYRIMLEWTSEGEKGRYPAYDGDDVRSAVMGLYDNMANIEDENTYKNVTSCIRRWFPVFFENEKEGGA